MNGQAARIRVRSQVGLKPLSLRRTGATAADLGTVTVENDDMPTAEVIAVIAFCRVSRSCTKVIEIAGGSWSKVFIIADCGMGAGLMAAPGGFITVVEAISRAAWVGIIPHGIHCARDIIEQLSRLFILHPATIGDIPRTDEYYITRWRGTGRRWRATLRRPNVGLLPRLKGVEVVGPPGAGVYSGYRPQPDPVYPPGVVIYPGQVCLLNTIDPQRQAPIVGAHRRRRLPVQLDKVRRIADRKPTAIDKGHAAVQQGVGPELIVAV